VRKPTAEVERIFAKYPFNKDSLISRVYEKLK
jgi:hypothetical protein